MAKRKEFVATEMMRHDGQHYEAGHLMLCYARQALESVGWKVGELDIHSDSPLNQECTGREHNELPYTGATTKTYCPGAHFAMTTKGGKKRYMCRQCVSFLAEAVLAKDRDRISELWNQMRKELRDPDEEDE